MKVLCDGCEKAAAAVVCCADEAALCWGCDEKIHAANKLAGKHQRVPLLLASSNSGAPSNASLQIPTCDICQEKPGYFFCLEDRALLCRQCDVAIHTASPHTSSHQRFLITGVRVALEHRLTDGRSINNSCSSSSDGNSTSSNTNSSRNIARASIVSPDSIADKKLQASTSMEEDFKQQWPWNEFLDGFEFDPYGLSGPGSSS